MVQRLAVVHEKGLVDMVWSSVENVFSIECVLYMVGADMGFLIENTFYREDIHIYREHRSGLLWTSSQRTRCSVGRIL